MAKDGTNRGGARVGAGTKKKPLADKIADGNPGRRKPLVIDFENNSRFKRSAHAEAICHALRHAEGRQDAGRRRNLRIHLKWLAERGCASLVSPQLLKRYAMSVAHWIQCKEAVTEYGFLAKHPTTGNAIQSPYVAMNQNFMSQTNRLWIEIYRIVKENCSGEYGGASPHDDVMERLLQTRRGKS